MALFLLHAVMGATRRIAGSVARARYRRGDRAGRPDPGHERRYLAALDALPDETRRIFLLHRAEDIDIATIAALTGYPTAEVERLIADAILALWQALDGDCA